MLLDCDRNAHIANLIIVRGSGSGLDFFLHVTFTAEFLSAGLIKSQIKQESQQEESSSRRPGLTRSHCTFGWLFIWFDPLLRKLKITFCQRVGTQGRAAEWMPSSHPGLLLCSAWLGWWEQPSVPAEAALFIVSFKSGKAQDILGEGGAVGGFKEELNCGGVGGGGAGFA